MQNLQPLLTPTHTYVRENDVETSVSLPCFPEYRWPLFLQQVVDCGESPAQRDILLLGALTVFGATLNRLLELLLYGRKIKFPCRKPFVIAPPASGKGALTWVRRAG